MLSLSSAAKNDSQRTGRGRFTRLSSPRTKRLSGWGAAMAGVGMGVGF